MNGIPVEKRPSNHCKVILRLKANGDRLESLPFEIPNEPLTRQQMLERLVFHKEDLQSDDVPVVTTNFLIKEGGTYYSNDVDNIPQWLFNHPQYKQ